MNIEANHSVVSFTSISNSTIQTNCDRHEELKQSTVISSRNATKVSSAVMNNLTKCSALVNKHVYEMFVNVNMDVNAQYGVYGVQSFKDNSRFQLEKFPAREPSIPTLSVFKLFASNATIVICIPINPNVLPVRS